jgi:hypothetical protein
LRGKKVRIIVRSEEVVRKFESFCKANKKFETIERFLLFLRSGVRKVVKLDPRIHPESVASP